MRERVKEGCRGGRKVGRGRVRNILGTCLHFR